jgi:hypothetical protein
MDKEHVKGAADKANFAASLPALIWSGVCGGVGFMTA